MKSPMKNMNDDIPMVMDMMATKVLPLLRHMTDSIRTKHERTALDSSYIPQSPESMPIRWMMLWNPLHISRSPIRANSASDALNPVSWGVSFIPSRVIV